MRRIYLFTVVILLCAFGARAQLLSPGSSTTGTGVSCAIGPNVAAIPAPAQAAGFNTCVANWDFGSTSNFTYNGATYKFSQPASGGGITGWLSCSGPQANALWWAKGYNSPNNPPCSDFNIINDSSIGRSVLSMIFTAADAANSVSATWMALWTGGGGVPVTSAVYKFPENLFIVAKLQMLPANTYPYSTQQACKPPNVNGTYCELMNFFAAQTSNPQFMEMDFLEMDGITSGAAYACGTNCGPGWSYGNAARFAYTEYGTLVTSDGTQSYLCGYQDGARFSYCGKVTTYVDDLITWGLGVGSNYFNLCYNGGPCVPPDAGVTPEMRIQYIRVFSCSNWNGGGPDVCNRSVITTPP
jgi:hypothetical protein